MKTGNSSVCDGDIQPVYLETESDTFVKNQPEQITLAEVLEFVSFKRGIDGKWYVRNVEGGVRGHIAGDVDGYVGGNVGTVRGDVGTVRGNVGIVRGNVGDVLGSVLGNVMGSVGRAAK